MGLGALLRNLVYTGTDTQTGQTDTWTVVTDGGPGMYASWASGQYQGGMALPGAWRAAQLLSDLLGAVPWHAYDDGPGGLAQRVKPNPLLLEQPFPPDTRMTTFSSWGLDLVWHGNAIGVWAGRDQNGEPTSAVPVPARSVGVDRIGPGSGTPDWPVGELVYYIGRRRFRASEVLHIKGLCEPGALRGTGVLENHLNGVLNLAAEQAKQAGGLADHAVPSVVITSSNPDLELADATAAKQAFMTSQRTRQPAVVNAGTKIEPLAWNPTETQLLEARKYSLHELALIFGLDPSWLGGSQTSRVYSNIEQEGINLWRYSALRGHLARFEQALSAAMPPGRRVQASLDETLRADTLTRYQAHEIALRAEFLTVDEVRGLENRAPLQGRDDGAAAARNIAEMVQKLYLGVGRVLTPDDARMILDLAGAGLGAAPTDLVDQAAAIAAKGTGGEQS